MKKSLLFLFLLLLIGCKSDTKSSEENSKAQTVEKNVSNIQYATAFDILEFDGYKEIIINDIWPNSDTSLRYLLIENQEKSPKNIDIYDAVVQVPVKKIVVTSTTHIPSLDMLGEIESLVGFPDLNFISSTSARARIDDGKITGIGKNEDINVERLLEVDPDLVIGFAVDGMDPKLRTISKAGIPVFYNSDWLETNPLGKAEWIKFFGALYGKYEEAIKEFATIEQAYLDTKDLAKQADSKPKVLLGAMYKDIWYVPQGDSWAAQFIDDAQGDYIWKKTKGTGSSSFGLEKVLETAHDADIWLNPSSFTSIADLTKANKVYAEFDAYKTGEIYTYGTKVGATGGIVYFELGPNRPDIVLKDLVYILHPELLPDYTPYFYTKLE